MNPLPPSAADLQHLSALAPALASTFVSLAGDVALVVDADGVVRHSAAAEAALGVSAEAWIGRPWADSASADTRRKLEALLTEVRQTGRARRREINHPAAGGLDIPVAWSALRLGDAGPVLALGRDLRAVAAIQQRFVETQQELERDYWQRRQAEARYRLLFQVATDAVLVVNAQSHQIVEANRAAAQLFGAAVDQLAGRDAAGGVDERSRPALVQLLRTAASSGQAAEVRVRSALDGAPLEVSATPFRADHALLLLMRVRPADSGAGGPSLLADYVERAPDAVAVTDSAGVLLAANPAFVALGADPRGGCEGHPIQRWLPALAAPLAAAIDDARRAGIAARRMLPAAGGQPALELNALLLPEGDQARIGFTLRLLAPGGPAEADDAALAAVGDAMADALQQLARQVGAQPLPLLMREAASVAERHLIEAAFERDGPDPDRVAQVLGIHRDSLELRMRRLGLMPGTDSRPSPIA